MRLRPGLRQPGVAAALAAALLFGVGAPLAKALLATIDPWMLAALLYLGSGIGLTLWRRWRHAPAVTLPRAERRWLIGAVLAGGVVGPVLLMAGLAAMPASGASLLLNAESVFTALIAWFVFKENVDTRIALGMGCIVAGALWLSWPQHGLQFSGLWPALYVLGACLAWGIDNNLTRKVSLSDATWIASVKGLVAGSVNLLLALGLGAALPAPRPLFGALLLGLLAYGVSLVLFVVALRHLGAARTGAYFSVAPFIGALLAVAMGDAFTAPLLGAVVLMALGVWLHLTERHEHAHEHLPQEHSHAHVHDDGHHRHDHTEPVAPGTRHNHPHRHEAMVHAHPHAPDMHHPHRH